MDPNLFKKDARYIYVKSQQLIEEIFSNENLKNDPEMVSALAQLIKALYRA